MRSPRSSYPVVQSFSRTGVSYSRTGSVVENQLENVVGFVGYKVFVTTAQLCGMKAAIGFSDTGFKVLKPSSDLSFWPIKTPSVWVLVWEIIMSRTC